MYHKYEESERRREVYFSKYKDTKKQLNEANKRIEELEEMMQEKNNIIEMKNKIIQEQDQMLQEKEAMLQEWEEKKSVKLFKFIQHKEIVLINERYKTHVYGVTSCLRVRGCVTCVIRFRIFFGQK